MIKVCLSVCLVFISFLIGVKLSEKQKVRKVVFEELLSFNKSFLCNVGLFRQSVIDGLMDLEGELKVVLSGANSCLGGGGQFICNDLRLTPSQRKIVTDYVNSLGTGDESQQREILSAYDLKFKQIIEEIEAYYNKSAKLYSRLGFALGLVLVVILI